jgi:hypothetical protein
MYFRKAEIPEGKATVLNFEEHLQRVDGKAR